MPFVQSHRFIIAAFRGHWSDRSAAERQSSATTRDTESAAKRTAASVTFLDTRASGWRNRHCRDYHRHLRSFDHPIRKQATDASSGRQVSNY